MKGYHNKPEATAEAITDDGWFRTGDIGRIDADGYIFVEDRLKDMIITGGENVYSIEVERVLAEHPAVAEVAVIGVPDDKWGEAVKAVVSLEGDASEADIIAFARSGWPPTSAPRPSTSWTRCHATPRQDPQEGPAQAALGGARAAPRCSRPTHSRRNALGNGNIECGVFVALHPVDTGGHGGGRPRALVDTDRAELRQRIGQAKERFDRLIRSADPFARIPGGDWTVQQLTAHCCPHCTATE